MVEEKEPAPAAGGRGPEANWLQPGVRALLCNLAKFPKLNGQEVEVKGWNAEKQRWKCLLPNGGDVNVMLSNLEPAEMPKDEVERVEGLLEEKRLFEAYMLLNGKANAPQDLQEKLEDLLEPGEHHENVDGRLQLVEIEKKGMGYKAAKPINKGDVLLFEAAAYSIKPQQSMGMRRIGDWLTARALPDKNISFKLRCQKSLMGQAQPAG